MAQPPAPVTNLMRVNPQHVKLRDQTLRLTAGLIAGPALVVAGLKYPGSVKVRAALALLGLGVTFTQVSAFHAER